MSTSPAPASRAGTSDYRDILADPPFESPWWLPGRHAQTLWAATVRRRPCLHLSWESMPLPDGDFIDLCWTGAGPGPIVIVLHGLEGNIESPYVRHLLRRVQDSGHGRAVLMHFRGCGGRPNRRDRSYHSGETGDLRHLVACLGRRFPGTPLAAVGFSLGGNVLLKYLGETRGNAGLVAAVAISVPYLLDVAATHLDLGFARVYRDHLLRRLRRKLADKFGDDLPPALGGAASRPQRLRTFHAFDDAVTAPLHGFTGADEYYDRSSSRRFLAAVTVPTLLVHAADDPFLPPTALPGADELSSSIVLELAQRGGHVGFVSGRWPWRDHDWLTPRILDYLRHHLE